ncbi:hypothetical protein ACI8AF_08540 [Blastococcus sp. SYSU D00669]
MILAAGLLVLVGLGLFVAGLATGTTELYWATVAVCVLAAVLLVLSRRGLSAASAGTSRAAAPPRAGTEDRPAREARAAREPAAPRSEDDTAPEREPEAAGEEAAEEPAAPEPPAVEPALDGPPTGAHAASGVHAATGPTADDGEPPVEDVEVTDLLLVVDLKDEVFVVDEHPRYHLADCPRLAGATAIPLPLDEARTDGFTPCGICEPDRRTADRERARRKA